MNLNFDQIPGGRNGTETIQVTVHEKALMVALKGDPWLMTSATIQELREVITWLEVNVGSDDFDLSHVVLFGENGTLGGGGHLGQMAAMVAGRTKQNAFQAYTFLEGVHIVIEGITNSPIPWIAYAGGGGTIAGSFELFLACKYRVVHPHTSLRLARGPSGIATWWTRCEWSYALV